MVRDKAPVVEKVNIGHEIFSCIKQINTVFYRNATI
jgi:hypothetical protein